MLKRLLIVSAIFLGGWYLLTRDSDRIDYNLDVKPVLNKHCISCHGGVRANGGFSLLNRDQALIVGESGNYPIVPGNTHKSELIRRIKSKDPSERMPLDKPALTDREIGILTRWIKQGAPWGIHWAYEPIKAPQTRMPNALMSFVSSKSAEEHFIDSHINRKLVQNKIKPKEEASPEVLVRRLGFDLIGLPPPSSLVERYVNKVISYEMVVDSLLANPGFGEKWTSMWLDIARYADSKGFERDPSRSIWRYRDYVIRAFNEDLGYDRFVIEQIAGDLLDNPTDDQLIATGFHRNTQTNDEGGTDNEEYRMLAVMDRVNTTWEGIMGTTMACVQCHGHPYDPIKHEGYYTSLAYFNNTRDADTHRDYPWLRFLDSINTSRLDSITTWINKVESSEHAHRIKNQIKTLQPIIYSIESDNMLNAEHYDTKYLGLRNNGSARFTNIPLSNVEIILVKLISTAGNGTLNIRLNNRQGEIIGAIPLKDTKWKYSLHEIPLKPSKGNHDLFLEYIHGENVDPNAMIVQLDWLYFGEGFPGKGLSDHRKMKELYHQLLLAEMPYTLIMWPNPDDRQRGTFLLDRGNWLTPTIAVNPDVPSVLAFADRPKDRLAFGRWIVDKNNPLTARTFVNRVWAQLFGRGIVVTLEDLGSQGDVPSHRELLDELAYRWMYDYHWSVKRLIKEIVLSDAYRRDASISVDHQRIDPYNQYLSRGARRRLSAEEIRDQALSISGLLNSDMYGAPVMPYQPEGFWQAPYSSERWETSQQEGRHRRSIYTFIKRTSPYPSFQIFDMTQREVCTARRIHTNTPLQVLVTLNDSTYREAAVAFASRFLDAEYVDQAEIDDLIRKMYSSATFREITPEKLAALMALYRSTAEQLLTERFTEEEAHRESMNIVATAILNMDEILVK